MYSKRLTRWLIDLPNVAAIGIGGSQASGTATVGSDVDLYVFTHRRIDPAVRRAIAEELADDAAAIEIANPYWGDEDGYNIEGVWHDVVFFDLSWFLGEINATTMQHRPQEGYSTSFVFTLMNLQLVHDPGDVLAAAATAVPAYPEELARAIISRNMAVACDIHASYANQVRRAVSLGDPVAANHRVAALLACATDIAFAKLRMWHPGEKRQLTYLRAQSDRLPGGFVDAIEQVLWHTPPDRMDGLVPAVGDLVERLREIAPN